MFRCDFCQKECETREIYAGHRSGHVRNGEIAKRKLSTRTCLVCKKHFPLGMGGHMKVHNKTFDELTDYRSKKHRLLEERGHSCEVCLTSDWMDQPIPIEIDHIDGNSSNNEKENLRLICPNCHAQTSTYRGKNVGNNPDIKRAETLKKHVGKYR